MYKSFLPHLMCILLITSFQVHSQGKDAGLLVKNAIDYWRSSTSYIEVSMTVYRPDWQRSMSLRSWTRGSKDALIIFTSPRSDAGNATLKLDQAMWMYTPRLNQVVKLPASMMAQSWMGSDFSYNDLAKSDQIINQYSHRLLGTEQIDGHEIYTVESIPQDEAPVVWGKEVLRIRDDFIVLQEDFYDQDMKLIRRMQTTRIGLLGGRQYPLVMRMTSVEKDQHWTEIVNRLGIFDLLLPDYLFTLSNLRNPRHWNMPYRKAP